jgi:hypothetical protein
MKTAMLTLAALLSLAPIPALAQVQTGDTAYEKKSYNYAEWAKGRFSEVVTVRNPGKIIYLGGVGSEDENSAQGGAIRHLGDFGAHAAMRGTKSSGYWKSTARRSRTSTRSRPTLPTSAISLRPVNVAAKSMAGSRHPPARSWW